MKDGRRTECLDCRAQNFRLYRKSRFDAKSSQDDSLIRTVKTHNQIILESLIQKGPTELRGFDYVTNIEYKVYYGPSERHGMDSLACFTRSGTVYFDYAFSGISDVIDFLLYNLKGMNIRLEWSDVDVILSKRVIYYLDEKSIS